MPEMFAEKIFCDNLPSHLHIVHIRHGDTAIHRSDAYLTAQCAVV